MPWQTRHPKVLQALRRVRDACAEAGVPFAAMTRTRQKQAEWRAAGVRAFVLGEERDLVFHALRTHLVALRGASSSS